MKEYLITQRVGDRDKVCYSTKPHAFTIPTNPMSDRIQQVVDARGACMSIPASYTKHPFKIMEIIYKENEVQDVPVSERSE